MLLINTGVRNASINNRLLMFFFLDEEKVFLGL
mgnify:CR=1 FL=1